MGAWFRFYERKIEREMKVKATRGMRPPEPEWEPAPYSAGGVRDLRTHIPPLGLREYWYPAIPARRVKARRPLFWKMLGDEVVFFRDGEGVVRALSDVCPHRGASLSLGKCFYDGTVTCPYHGATFDGEGACTAYLTEGPASRMVANHRFVAKRYPTETLKGWVFIWMGESDPVPIENDVPPELFEPKTSVVVSTYTYWQSSWILAIENAYDSHNQGLFVHRNSVNQLTRGQSLPRAPFGLRSKLVNDASLFAWREHEDYYADEAGKLPFRLYYPGVDGHWPKSNVRRWIAKPFRLWQRFGVNNPIRKRWVGRVASGMPEEWKPGQHRLPGMVRLDGRYSIFNRWAVPVEANLARIVYFHTRRANNLISRLWVRAWHWLYYFWWMDYNFSGQDNRAGAPCRYWTREHLSPTDSHLILLRRLIVERSRDAKLGRINADRDPTPAEELSFAIQRELGRERVEESLDVAAETDLERIVYDGTRTPIG